MGSRHPPPNSVNTPPVDIPPIEIRKKLLETRLLQCVRTIADLKEEQANIQETLGELSKGFDIQEVYKNKWKNIRLHIDVLMQKYFENSNITIFTPGILKDSKIRLTKSHNLHGVIFDWDLVYPTQPHLGQIYDTKSLNTVNVLPAAHDEESVRFIEWLALENHIVIEKKY